MIVENIIPRNVIINRGAAEVDNHISRDVLLLSPFQECYIYYILNFFLPFFPLTMMREVPRTAHWAFATNGCNDIFHKRVVFVNSFSVQADHDHF